MFGINISKVVCCLGLVTALTVGASSTAKANGYTARSYTYCAWVETQAVIALANQEFVTSDFRWQWAFNANVNTQRAFFEIDDILDGERGASWDNVVTLLDEAAMDLWLMDQEVLSKNLRKRVRSAMRYISIARSNAQRMANSR